MTDKLEPFCIAAVAAVRSSLVNEDARVVFGSSIVWGHLVMFHAVPIEVRTPEESQGEESFCYTISAGGNRGVPGENTENDRFLACLFIHPKRGVDAKLEFLTEAAYQANEEGTYVDLHADTPGELAAAIGREIAGYVEL